MSVSLPYDNNHIISFKLSVSKVICNVIQITAWNISYILNLIFY